MGAGTLAQMLEGFKTHADPRLVVGYDKSDDASVYVLSEDLALIQTTDFFPPIVDDPYLYGKIAATNALSDVYAMGGEPKLALNIFCAAESMETRPSGRSCGAAMTPPTTRGPSSPAATPSRGPSLSMVWRCRALCGPTRC